MRVNWSIPVTHRDYNRMPASVWIRCLQLLPYLNEYGVRSLVNDPAGDAGIEIFIRQINEASKRRMRKAREAGKKVIFDLCVNYFDPVGVSASGVGTTAAQRDELLRMLELADVVICASEYIARRAGAYHPRALCLPDSVDPQHFSHRKAIEDFNKVSLTLVYAGVAAKTDYLFASLYPELKKSGFRLLVIADRRPHLLHRYNYRRWRYESFPRAMLAGEIGIAPRTVASPYDRGHSIFKIGVFLAQGMPVLASPVPSYHNLLGEGKGGIICETPEAWREALQGINENRELLAAYSAKGMELMEPYFTANIARRYHQLFRELLKGEGDNG